MRPHASANRRRGSGVELQIAPMIDVVFLLLMYFMIATDFSPAEEVFRLDLPEQRVGEADPLQLLDEPLRVRVVAAGADGQQARVTVEGPWDVAGSADGLRVFLSQSLVPQGSLFMPDHPIVIVPSPRVGWGHVVAIFNAAVAAGCTNVTLETPS
ncbi:MAG: biopolymer transporter ExbD [Phycisphaerales bacterium]|nr:biopolymer transporter ExbD [Phycisphaerales bacterium]MDP6312328.1 biopolymer transporter ExbD [Phycisphaerales bacterium]MDP7087644.1 biopolymer transporter ExbD [Phycisphaerales bacterium]